MADRPYDDNPGATHFDGCWRTRGHHNCAVAALAEQSALLALWSSGEAGTLPDGWTCAADRVPSLERDLGRLTAEVDAGGGWFIWRDLKDPDDDAEVLERHPGPRPILTACAEASERLEQLGVEHG